MYSTQDREKIFNSIVSYINDCPFFEGIIQIGSGTIGYHDIYSDIDLMAGCYRADEINNANEALILYFKSKNAIYIDKRSWSEFCLGLSAYFDNGLSVDISFAPTNTLEICSTEWKIILDKTEKLTKHVQKDNELFLQYYSNYGVDNSIIHKFIFELRKCEIAIRRNNFIYAEISLSQARQYLLNIQVLNENKKLHQFKAYNTLNKSFLCEIEKTYPTTLSREELSKSKSYLLDLFKKTVKSNKKLNLDNIQLKLLDF